MTDKILFLNPHFNDIDKESFDNINFLYPNYESLSFLKKLKWLLNNGTKYSKIIFYRDHRLMMAYYLCSFFNGSQKLGLHEFYMPAKRHMGVIKSLYFKLLFKISSVIIVHSQNEAIELTAAFKLAKYKIKSLKYFCYDTKEDGNHINTGLSTNCNACVGGGNNLIHNTIHRQIQILVPGRHRDLKLIDKLSLNDNIHITVICGKDDKIQFTNVNVSVLCEVSKKDYDYHFQQADIIVIPISQKEGCRSLGKSL